MHTLQRSDEEPPTAIYTFPKYTDAVDVAALASVCGRLRDLKASSSTTRYQALRRDFPFVAPLDQHEMLPPSVENALVDMSDTVVEKLAHDFVQRTLKGLKDNGFESGFRDIIFVSTTPGDESEQYHRDGGADDNTYRMIIFGTDTGPGTYFAEGACNFVDTSGDRVRDTHNRTGYAPRDWIPIREVYVPANAGSAVLFTGNMCHRREKSPLTRWGILINLVKSG